MNKLTSEMTLRRDAGERATNRPVAKAIKYSLFRYPPEFWPALALREQAICGILGINRPAKPLWISVLTLKSRGFFIASRKYPSTACRRVG